MANGEPKKILIAEPDLVVGNIYKEKFEELGYSVSSAFDGDEVINKAEMEFPDLIFIDAILPKKNCYEILEALKAKESTKKIPVIIISDFGEDKDIRKALEMGATLYFIKSKSRLIDVIQNIEGILESIQ